MKQSLRITQKLFSSKGIMLLVMMFVSLSAYSQSQTITGKVIDETTGESIPGVTVQVLGKSGGAITDIDGNYSIEATLGATLKFSFIGMKTVEKAANQAKLDVSMESDSYGLEEVVTIGYGTAKKKELTGAVAQVKAEDLTRIVTSDLGAALQGQVAGVNIIASSGDPGAQSEILIRGISSIDGSNTPLFVVDGIPQEGDPGLSPNEIETLDILKDAASCAIYGTRGAAGVILITTKQGSEGSMKLSVNGSYGVQSITSGTPLMNTVDQTYFDMVTFRNVNNMTDDKIQLGLSKQPKGFTNDTDLGEVVFIDFAPVQDYNANISGGTKDLSYNVVAGYHKKDGVIINSDFERFNTRINTIYNHGKWRINSRIGLTDEETNKAAGNLIVQTIKYRPTQEVIDPTATDAITGIADANESNRLTSVLESFQNTDNLKRTKVFANFKVSYKINKSLTFNTSLGTNITNDYRHRFNPYQETYLESGKPTGTPKTTSSFVQMDAGRRSSVSADAGLSYNKKFNKVHSVKAVAVGSLEKYTYGGFYAKKYGVFNNDIDLLSGTTANPVADSYTNYVNTLVGTIGRVQYGYKGKYLLSSSVRIDGSSKFAKENFWGVFPSASAAWNVSDERFFKPMKKVANNLKLRASYGTVGNQNFAPYSYSNNIDLGSDYLFGGGLDYGAIQKAYANSDVKWETSVQGNVGMDLGLFNNKLTFTAEYYNTKKQDMLFPLTWPSSGGVGQKGKTTLNIGNMTNQGYELAAGYKVQMSDMMLRFNGTFSTNNNEVTEIFGLEGFVYTDDSGLISGAPNHSKVTGIAKGYEAGAFFVYKTDGIVDTHEKLAAYQKLNPAAQMGDLIHKDTNGDGTISEADKEYGGSGLPEYEVGFNMTADYKGFDFSMNWYAAIGHEIMNGAKATAFGYGRHQDLLYAWSEANPVTSIPAYRGDTKAHANYTGYTDLWLEDGTYLRLKQITLGYSLSQRVVDKMGLGKLRFYVSAQNPLTFTKYEGYDPEIGGGVKSRGLDKGNYPVSALYLVGLNLKF